MVSEIPMFSLKFKNLKLKDNAVRFLFLAVVFVLTATLRLYAFPLIIVWYVLLSVVTAISTKK
jgi:CDP-diacylglycerol--serine O-phosphatidyltransferase